MSNDFLAVMSSHADDCALVYGEFSSRAKVLARLKTCKTEKAQAEAEVWLWGARMVQYVAANVKGATMKTALGMVAAEKAKAAKARATWYDKAASAARNYAFHARKEAGLIATDKRGGKRDNAGRKGETTKPETVASETVAAKPETVKPETSKVAPDYKPATPRESAMFLRENIAALISIAKGAHNSAAMIKALTACLAQAQAEIKNCG